MSQSKEFIKNTGIVTLGHILVYMQGIILMPLIIKNVGAGVYGGYILILTITGFVYGISSFGVGLKRSRFLPSSKSIDESRDLYYPAFFFHFTSLLLLSLFLYIVFPLVQKHIFKSDLYFSGYLIIPYMMTFLVFSHLIDYFRYTHKMGCYTFATTAAPYMNILLIFLVRKTMTVDKLIVTQIITYSIISVILAYRLYKELGFSLIFPRINAIIADIKLGYPLVFNFLIDSIMSANDRFVISTFISVAALGYYAPGFTLGSAILFFPRMSGVVLTPLLSKAVDSGNVEHANRMLAATRDVFLLFAIPFFFGACFLSKQLLMLFANNEVAEKAYMVVPIIALGSIFYGLNIILSNALFVRLRTDAIFKVNFIAATLSLVLNIVFIYLFRSIIAAAATSLVCYLVSYAYMHGQIQKHWPIFYNFRIIRGGGISASLMGFGLLIMDRTFYGQLNIFLKMLIAGALYFSFLFVLRILRVGNVRTVLTAVAG